MFYFDSDKFNKECKNAMKAKEVSYRILAKRLHISHSRLHNMLNNKAKMSVHNMLEISNTLDLNPYEFIDEREYQLSFLERIG